MVHHPAVKLPSEFRDLEIEARDQLLSGCKFNPPKMLEFDLKLPPFRLKPPPFRLKPLQFCPHFYGRRQRAEPSLEPGNGGCPNVKPVQSNPECPLACP